MVRRRQTLSADPASPGAARRFATDILNEAGQPELSDLVALLLSELVTNAVLHAGSDVELEVALLQGRVRIEVADASPVMPAPREHQDDAMTGRGLEMVAMLASDWGVDPIPGDGKVVWFEIADVPRPPGSAPTRPRSRPRHGHAEIKLLGVPVQLFTAMHQHTEALLREYVLMALHHTGGEGSAPRLALDMNAVSTALQVAAQAGGTTADLTVTAPPEAAEDLADVREALAAADGLAGEGLLLNAQALPEVRQCRDWFLGEAIAQLGGAVPTRWTPAGVVAPGAGHVQVDHAVVLDHLDHAVIVADDHNQIAYANSVAEEMFGWEPGHLRGQRLTAVIPERLHEAHISGYTRYLVTHQPRLIGSAVRVPARRRDGTEIEVNLTLNAFRSADGRLTFIGELRGVDGQSADDVPPSRQRALRAVNAVVAALGEERIGPPEESASRLLGALASELGWQFAAWWQVHGDELRCAGVWEDRAGDYASFHAATLRRVFTRGTGLPGRVWDSGEAMWLPDVVADANFPRVALAIDNGLRSACAFPVVLEGTTVGVIELLARELLEPDPATLSTLATVGRVVGLAALH